MEPTLVDLVSDPPRLVYPDGSWCPTTRTQARIEALRIVRQTVPVGSPPAPTGTLSLAASGCGSEDAGGGEARTWHGESPSTRENRWTDMGTYWEAT
jgi:hypothetical protein